MGRILSIDIKNRNIKIIEGAKSGSSLTIHKSLFLDLDPGNIDDGKIIDIDVVADIIDTALKVNNIKTKNATFIINTNSTISRTIELPILKSNSETLSMIKNELDQLLPVDIEQYKIVFKHTDTISAEGAEKGVYIVDGLPNTMYEQYMELSTRLKLELTAIDLSSNCLDKVEAHKLTINNQGLKPGSSTAFIDIGYNNISFSIVKNGKTVFSRISSNGLNDIVRNFTTAFELNHIDALEEIKRVSLIGSSENVLDSSKANIIEDNVNMWIDEFNRFIRYYNSNNKEKQIQKIYVYGSYAIIAELDKFLELRLNISTEEIKEVSNISNISLNIKDLDVKSYFNTILSLYIGKKDINFLSDKKKQRKSKFSSGVILMALVLIAVLTIAFYTYSYIVEKSALEKDIAIMSEFISNEENIKLNNEAIEMKNKAALLQTYKDEVDKVKTAIKNEDAVNTIIFEQIATSVPIGTKVNSMSIDKNSIQMQCTSASRQEVAQFEKNLKQIEFVGNVYIPTVVDTVEGGSVRYSYSVICDVKDVTVNEVE